MDTFKLTLLSLIIFGDIVFMVYPSLPEDPIFFQALIRDRATFDNFLLSNANIGRAQVTCCRPPKPPNPNITGPPAEPTKNPVSEAIFFSAPTLPPPYWVVGDCLNDFRATDVIRRVIGAGKVIMLWVTDLCDNEWDVLYNQVNELSSVLIYWNIAIGPGVGAFDLMPLQVPENAAGLQGVVLGFLEGISVSDNEDDRYWDYHFEQMATLMNKYPLANITTKLISFNGLYLARSLANSIENCTQADGFFHYINSKDMIRLMPRYYRQKLESYGFQKAYNIWGVTEFFAPDFSRASKIGLIYTYLNVVVIALFGQ